MKVLIAALTLSATLTAQRGDTARTLDGVIDIHVHSAPDNVARSIDSIDVAKRDHHQRRYACAHASAGAGAYAARHRRHRSAQPDRRDDRGE